MEGYCSRPGVARFASLPRLEARHILYVGSENSWSSRGGRMVGFGRSVRVMVACSLMLSVSGASFCPCLPSPHALAQSPKNRPAKQWCCGQAAVGCGCATGCCQKQTPQRDDRDLPKPDAGDRNRLVTKCFLAVELPSHDLEHGLAMAAISAASGYRLESSTLRAQHTCMQI
jgi:hypothetical protein